jgi:hypothetical protein
MNQDTELRDKLERLRRLAPLEADGLFQTLHYPYGTVASLETFISRKKRNEQFGDAWRLTKSLLRKATPTTTSLLHEVFVQHAREFGTRVNRAVAEQCWAAADPFVRGNFLAGFAGRVRKRADRAWLKAHLAEVKFGTVAACETAVEATTNQVPQLLSLVLAQPEVLRERVPRPDALDKKCPWQERAAELSDFIVDLILEAGLKFRYLPAIRGALAAGANPNLKVWVLGRSYNEKFCPLSYAIEHEMPAAAQLLLEAGADPRGTPYGGRGKPLFAALANERDRLADQLLAAGASFQERDDPVPRTSKKKKKKDRFSESGFVFYDVFPDELEEVRKAIGDLVPLVEVKAKRSFYKGNGQGGSNHLLLPTIVGDNDNLKRLKKYEARGLDVRLSAEDICHLVRDGAVRCLTHLLDRAAPEATARVITQLRRAFPEFRGRRG